MTEKTTLFQKLVNDNRLEIISEGNPLRYSKKLKFFIIATTVLICTVFFSLNFDDKTLNSPNFSLVPGYIWQGNSLIADFSFPIYKSSIVYEQEVTQAKKSVLNVFINDKAIESDNLQKLNQYSEFLFQYPTLFNNEVQLNESTLKNFFILPANQTNKELKKIISILQEYITESYKYGFVNINLEKLVSNEIAINISPTNEIILKKTYLKDRTTFIESGEKFLNSKLGSPSKELALELLNKLNNPNLIFNKELTDNAVLMAINSVPKTNGFVKQGEIIVKKGEIVSEQLLTKIKSYETSRFVTGENIAGLSYYLGSFGHSALIMSILLVYLIVIRKKIYADNVQLAILCLIIIAVSFFSWGVIEIESGFPLEYLIPLPAFAMLAAIVFDSRTAFYITVTMSLILAGIHGNDYSIALTMMFSGTLAAYTVRDIQNRTQMFQSIFFIFIGLAIPILVFSAERSTDSISIIKMISVSLLTSTISPLITFGLLFVIERLTNITTDLRIKEFDKLDHPLLLKMAEIAPGTYQHTLGVALLAERCAREIDANPLLAKVGAYYHDIGKMNKAEYFTENQINIDNKHDSLQPKKSVKIITDHIQNGIDLANQYKLPQRLIDFIPMHHGTSLIKHFYAKALEESNGKEIDESEFRYKGPKPNSKETAILMICDFAEAISRLESKTLEEIESIIEGNIQGRIIDGQFDNCDITISELFSIKQVIAKNLLGMTHKRTNYKPIPKIN